MYQSHDSHHGPYGQPGLETVGDQPDLELAANEHLRNGYVLPEALHHHPIYAGTGKESVAPAYSSAYPEHYTPIAPYPPNGAVELGETQQKPRRKRLWIIIGLLVAVVVILAAVMGGVMGSRAANSSSGDDASAQTGGDSGESAGAGDANNDASAPSSTTTGDASSPTSTNSQANSQAQIRQGSGLSVTGWRKPDGSVESFLFYQCPDDGLRYSRRDTGDRSQDDESTGWGSPIIFGGDYAKSGTRLGGTAIVVGDKYKPQLEVFYTGFETRLLGLAINNQLKPNTTDDSINGVDIDTGLDSAIAALWPWIIYQDSTGQLIQARNRVQGDNRTPTSIWDVDDLDLKALRGSRIAMAPMLTDFGRIATKGGYAIFYQDPNEKLAVHITELDSPDLDEDYPLSWPTAIPSITLPWQASIAAFSVARAGGDRLGRVDTYVLYLDDNNDINVLYTDSWSDVADDADGTYAETPGDEVEAEWKTTKPEALKGVDEDTDIACLDMATSRSGPDEEPLLLEEVSADTARCYFQKGGEVVEVRLEARGDERDWVVVGTVPIPSE